MSKKTALIVWLVIILVPVPLWASIDLLGFFALIPFCCYYVPLWGLGEPFFYCSDMGFFPTAYGVVVAPVTYSIIYWLCVVLWWRVRRYLDSKHHPARRKAKAPATGPE